MSIKKEDLALLKADLASLEEYARHRKNPSYKTPKNLHNDLKAEARFHPNLLEGEYKDQGLVRKLYAFEQQNIAISADDHPDQKGNVRMLNNLNKNIHAWIDGNEAVVNDIKRMLDLHADTPIHDLLKHIHERTIHIEKHLAMAHILHHEIVDKRAALLKEIKQEAQQLKESAIDGAHIYIKIKSLISWLETQGSDVANQSLDDVNILINQINQDILELLEKNAATCTPDQLAALFKEQRDTLAVAHNTIDKAINRAMQTPDTRGVLKRFVSDTVNRGASPKAYLQAWERADTEAKHYKDMAMEVQGDRAKLPTVPYTQQSASVVMRTREANSR